MKTYQEIIDSYLPLDQTWHEVSEYVKKLEAVIKRQDDTLEKIEHTKKKEITLEIRGLEAEPSWMEAYTKKIVLLAISLNADTAIEARAETKRMME